MTDARLVWDTWRRILTNDALVDAVLHPGDAGRATLALTPDQAAIFADYASTPAATDQTIFMYRSSLVRNAICALRLTPLAHRLLYMSALDAQAVARDFTESAGYRDDGPNLWRLTAAFAAYLAKLPDFADGAKAGALAIEAAAIALVRRLGEMPPAWWPDDAAVQPAGDPLPRYVASRAAVAVSSQYDLTSWLEDPFGFDVDAALERVASHWLIYVPNAEAAHTYAELSERAARAFTLMAVPKTAAELAADLGLPAADALEVIDSLAELGAVAIEKSACLRE